MIWLVSVEALVRSRAQHRWLRSWCCSCCVVTAPAQKFNPWPKNFHILWVQVKKKTLLINKIKCLEIEFSFRFISFNIYIFILFPGIVVEDCLILLQNLLKNNNSNQNFFKEGSYIQRMKPWFEVGDENSGWSAQKVTNLHLMLQVWCLCHKCSKNFDSDPFEEKNGLCMINPGCSVGFT